MAGPWFYRSLATGTGDGLSWANARVTLATMTSVVAGDTIWVADDHSETATGTVTLAFPGTPAVPNLVICADHLVTSPGTGNWKTTGIVAGGTTSSTRLDINGSFYCYGLTFRAGLGMSGGSTIRCQSSAIVARQIYENCVIHQASTSSATNAVITIGSATQSRIVFINTAVQFTASLQFIQLQGAVFEWRSTPTPLLGFIPQNLFQPFASSVLICEGVDFSAFTSTSQPLFGTTLGNIGVWAYFNNCRFVAGIQFFNTVYPGQQIVLNGSGSDASAAWRSEKQSAEGTETLDGAIFRVGGASDGTRSFTRRINNLGGACGWAFPYTGLPIVKWNATTGANVSITVYGCIAAATLPTNDQVWIEVSWLGNATYPMASIGNTTKANASATGTTLTADTTPWDCPLTRANGTVYVPGQAIKTVSSNPGRVFMCTGAGTTSGGEPAGFATATDGTQVSDGTATFRAVNRFSITYTISSPQPQLVGPIYVTPKVGATSSLTIYLDPEL